MPSLIETMKDPTTINFLYFTVWLIIILAPIIFTIVFIRKYIFERRSRNLFSLTTTILTAIILTSQIIYLTGLIFIPMLF